MDNVAKGRLLVTIQFILLGSIAFITSPDLLDENTFAESIALVLEVVGFVLLIAGFRGLGPSLTANPVPLKNVKLVTKGIYSRMRHPIYAGLIVVTLGIVLSAGSTVKFYFWVPLVVLISIKIQFEEALLMQTYPGYAKYKEEVPSLFPKLKKKI